MFRGLPKASNIIGGDFYSVAGFKVCDVGIKVCVITKSVCHLP